MLCDPASLQHLVPPKPSRVAIYDVIHEAVVTAESLRPLACNRTPTGITSHAFDMLSPFGLRDGRLVA